MYVTYTCAHAHARAHTHANASLHTNTRKCLTVALPPKPAPFPSVAARSRRGRPGIRAIAWPLLCILGRAYDSLRDFSKAIEYHTQHLAIAKEVGDRAGEGRA